MIMNTELLKQLYCIFSPSGNTKKMRRFLKKEIVLRGGYFVQDQKGNILVTKGEADTYPCLASHIDQVSNHTHPKDFRCIESDGIIMGYSNKLKQQCGLGADDKNGIFICLNALQRYDAIKIAFFVDEEIGCRGSEEVDLSFFDDCRFIIEPDRRDGDNFISCMSGVDVCSKEFIEDSKFRQFGYRHDEGSITDVLTLLERGLQISCLNLSCGYYNAHTDEEVSVVAELENCQNFVFHMIDTMQKVYPFEYQALWSDNYWGDSDYDVMDDILANDPDVSFEDILMWKDIFINKNEDHLECLYNDIKDSYRDYFCEDNILQ